MRGKPTARYIERDVFRHNDSKLSKQSEHYVDNFRERNESADAFSKLSHEIFKAGELMKSLPLEEDEARRLNLGLRCFMQNFLEPRKNIAYLNKMKLVSELNDHPLHKNIEQAWSELVKEIKAFEKDNNKREILRDKWIRSQVVPDEAYVDKVISTDPLFRQMRYLFNKYESPKRRAKRKIINEKLSKNYTWEGKKTDDYTGVEAHTPVVT